MKPDYLSKIDVCELTVTGRVVKPLALGPLPAAAIRGSVGGYATTKASDTELAKVLFAAPPALTAEAGQPYSFDVVLIGEGCANYKTVIKEIHAAMRTDIGGGKMALTSIMQAHASLLIGNQVHPPTARNLGEIEPLGEAMTLQLLSPIRLIADKQVVRSFDFAIMVWRMIERQMAYAHQLDAALISTVVGQARQAQVYPSVRWQEATMNSSRSGVSELGGWVGDIALRGVGPELSRVLQAGAILGVGKNVTKGAGRYAVHL